MLRAYHKSKIGLLLAARCMLCLMIDKQANLSNRCFANCVYTLINIIAAIMFIIHNRARSATK